MNLRPYLVSLLPVILLISCPNDVAYIPQYTTVVATPEVREKAVWYAREYIEAGTQYEWGGQDPLPRIVIDCSGLVIRCYDYAASDLGFVMLFSDTNSQGLVEYTQPLKAADLRTGDILFMGDDDIISHVALFVKIENENIVFIDSTYKPDEGINGVSERSYPMSDPRFISFGRMLLGKQNE